MVDANVNSNIPVNIDSSNIQFPDNKAASHCIVQPPDGISRISPGTRYLVSIRDVV